MIFVLAGTRDAREITDLLLEASFEVLASVVSGYGKVLLDKKPGLFVNDQPLDQYALEACLKKNAIRAFIDASHPYAVNASETAIRSCQHLQIPYLRYERKETPLPDYEQLYLVKNYQEAAILAARFGKNIFLTTGSRNLSVLKNHPALQGFRLIARVLPEVSVIEECRQLGFLPGDIIALQGPFSHELNRELYKNYEASSVITKNSGHVGGTDTKIAAAIELQLPVIVIDRVRIDYPAVTDQYPDVLTFIEKNT